LAGAIHIGRPQKSFVFNGMSQNGGTMKDGRKTLAGKNAFQGAAIPDISLDIDQMGMIQNAFLQIDVDALHILCQQAPQQNFSEKSRSSRYQNFIHCRPLVCPGKISR
jgi:hypothetical protein